MKNRAIISLGSNCGDKAANVKSALEWLRACKDIELISSSGIYETPEIHGRDITYMNAVAAILFDMKADEMNSEFKKYEVSFGRTEDCRRSGMVPIDIDIVILNDVILRPQDYNSQFFSIGFDEINDNRSLVTVSKLTLKPLLVTLFLKEED